MSFQATPAEVAKYIDHTLLKPVAGKDDIQKLCDEARQYGFMSVCVNPVYVPFCVEQLKGSDVLVCTVVGFPLGVTTTAVKALETAEAVTSGAGEIDMVINLGLLKSGSLEWVEEDIAAVVRAAQGVPVKVIIETCYLNDEEKATACRLAESAGAAFVKTSTGFGGGGATEADVKLMRATVSEAVKVKASGGVRNLHDLKVMVAAGADRIGASAGVAIMKELGGESSGSASGDGY